MKIHAGPPGHEAKAVGVGVEGQELSAPPHDGVDAADGGGAVIDLVAKGHDVHFVGDGHVESADVLPGEEGGQRLRLQLDEPVARTAQGGVDGHGPAVAQLPAQKTVNQLAHGHTSA